MHCSTIGCPQPATHVLSYTFPESREIPETDVVCEFCGAAYLRRPTLKATLAPMDPCRCGHPTIYHEVGVGICDDCGCNAYRLQPAEVVPAP